MSTKRTYTTEQSPISDEGEQVAPFEYCTGFVLKGWIGEQILDPTTGTSAFEVASTTGERKTVRSVPGKRSGRIVCPLESALIEKGRLLLPSGSQPYGSTEGLVGGIRAHIHKYVILPLEDESLCVHYILFTWLFDRFDTAPYLRFIGDLGSGKSRALRVIGDLCYKPFKAGGSATMSPVFRCLDGFGGCTLCMDEIDLFARNDAHQEMMTMLRQGFQRGAGVLRASRVGDDFEPRDYDVFGPKVLAGRQTFPDAALESRCIRIYMQTGVNLGSMPEELPAEYQEEAQTLRNMLLRWRQDHFFKPLREVQRLAIEPRLGQIYAPLARVINDPATLGALQGVMLTLQSEMTEARRTSLEGCILEAAVTRSRSEQSNSPVKIYIKELADDVRKERGWTEPPHTRKVAAACRGLGIEVKKDAKGSYVLFTPEDAGEVLERYGLAA